MTQFRPGQASNVLFVVLDTVRADSSYVAGAPFTPTLEALASDGADFRRAISPAAWTLPAHASIYTGKYPQEHGATAKHRYVPGEHELLAETVAADGIHTGLFTANAFLTESFNMARGFDDVSFIRGEANKLFADGLDPIAFLNEREHDEGLARLKEISAALREGPFHKNLINAVYFKILDELRRRRGIAEPASWDEQAVKATREFVSRHASDDDPFFAMVNLIGAHAPWEFDRELLTAIDVRPEDIAPLDRWREVASVSEAQWPYAAGQVELDATDRRILEHLYEAWIVRVDELAGELLAGLEEAGVSDDTLVVITADHGEQIARDGVLGHSVSVDESVTHVPLVIKGPGVPSIRIDRPVSLKDLHGTVLAALGVDEDARTVFDDEAQGTAYTETYGVEASSLADEHAFVANEFGARWALYTDEGRAERREDGQEFGDESVLARLDEFRASIPEYNGSHDEDISADAQERLEELGYV